MERSKNRLIAAEKLSGTPVPPEDRRQTTALARGLEILRCFTTTRTQLGSAEIARLTGLPQPTVWRLCQTLLQTGYLLPAPGNQRLQLGTTVLALGFAASAAFDILDVVRPRMQDLANRFNSAFSVAGRDALDMVYLQRCSAEAMMGRNLHRGSRIRIVKSTLGWAYLAAVQENVRNALLRGIKNDDAAQWPAIEKQLALVLRDYEKKGFVLRRGLSHRDVIAIAIPIVSSTGSKVLAINCSGHISDLSATVLENEVAPELKNLATAISGALSTAAGTAEPAR